MKKAGICALVGAMIIAAASLRAKQDDARLNDIAFEVASIKQNVSGESGMRINFPPGGNVVATNVPLRLLIASAYGTPQGLLPLSRILGGPQWIDSDRFDVRAKAATNYDDQRVGNTPPAQLLLMLRTLLADRFRLIIRDDTVEQPIYTLVLARNSGPLGPGISRSDVDCAEVRRGPPPKPGERLKCGLNIGPTSLVGGSQSMSQLAAALSVRVDRTVLDRTGLSGSFTVDLSWRPDEFSATDPVAREPDDRNLPSIFTAVQEQLGLRLQPDRGPVPVLVIEGVDRPSED